MALVAKISAKSGKSLKSVALKKGKNAIVADQDAVVIVVDEATGKVIENAHVERHGDELTITVTDTALAYVDSASGSTEAAERGSGDAGHAEASSLVGAGVPTIALLGGLLVAGIAVAAASGGGKGNSGGGTTPPPSCRYDASDCPDRAGSRRRRRYRRV